MNVGATESIAPSSMMWQGRLRGLFGGMGYAMSLAVIVVVTWTVQQQANDFPRLSLAEAFQQCLHTLIRHAGALLPTIPLFILAVNLAPRRSHQRASLMAGAIVLSALWGTTFWVSDVRNPSWFSFLLERLLSAALMAIVCLYHNSMRGAEEALLKEQIENATLDTALDAARLQLLRSQMEPHFLFNTLANVRTLVKSDRAAAVDMLSNLMRYLDAALPKLRQETCPLIDEMEQIEAYLSIHRVRMGPRLAYSIDVPSELAGVRVPTMMLLTLVENALKHGLNPSVEGGFIRVSAMRRGDEVLIKVADSGHGLSASHTHGSGTGLANIRVRLMLQYGEAAQFSLGPAEPRGVIASISIPAPP